MSAESLGNIVNDKDFSFTDTRTCQLWIPFKYPIVFSILDPAHDDRYSGKWMSVDYGDGLQLKLQLT